MAEIIEIPYKPRNWANDFHECLKRWFAIVLHRRAGKTTAIINHHQRYATDDELELKRLRFLSNFSDKELHPLLRNRLYGHIMPTYKQAKLVAWDMLKYYSKPIRGAITNESELYVRYPNNSKLMLFGADNPDSFRGVAFSGVSFDEYSQHPPNVFGEVISKALADHLGYAVFAGTIKGKNQLYRAYKGAVSDPKWFSIWQDINVSLKNEEGITIEMLRRAMNDDMDLIKKNLVTQEEFDQEWLLSTNAAIKGAIYGKEIAKAKRDNRFGVFPYDQAQLVHTVWDLGVGPAMTVGFYQSIMAKVTKIDCWEGVGNDALPEAVKAVKEKEYVYGKHFAPHDRKATERGTGKTIEETAKNLGIKFSEVPDIGINNGINSGKLFFSKLYINEEKCRPFLDAIEQYKRPWDDKRGEFKSEPLKDWTSHWADEHRYASIISNEMTNELVEPVTSYTPQLREYKGSRF